MKRLVILICCVLLVLAGIWSYTWWHSPAETKQISTVQASREVLGSERTLTAWNSQYFTTRYPSDFRIITANEVAHGLTTGQYLLGSITPNKTDQLGVTVGELNNSTLDELSAVKMRQQRTDIYEQVTLPFTPPGGQVFTVTDGYEMAMFWEDGSDYAAVVVSGSSARRAELQAALEAVVTNWQWRS